MICFDLPFEDLKVLITGAAGFIGSRLGAALLSNGHEVVGFDNFHEQVHGINPPKDYPFPIVDGDIRDFDALLCLLASHDFSIIYHLAAETGTGQSFDEPTRYSDVNVLGTTKLFEAIRKTDFKPKKIILAGTRAVYGEGLYVNELGEQEVACTRNSIAMENGDFDVYGINGNKLFPKPTPETLQPTPDSVYASSKLMQEHLIKNLSSDMDWTILRFQNVYGPGQSLRNPYTGVLSIFCSQILSNKTLEIYEDGEIYRDFVFVDDVVESLVAVIDKGSQETINIGSGSTVSMKEVVHKLFHIASKDGFNADYKVSGRFRDGDIRFAQADITKARDLLDWNPSVDLEEGLSRLIKWSLENV